MFEAMGALVAVVIAVGLLVVAAPLVGGLVWLLLLPLRIAFELLLVPIKLLFFCLILPFKLLALLLQVVVAAVLLPVVLIVGAIATLAVLGGLGVLGIVPLLFIGLPILCLVMLIRGGRSNAAAS